MPAVIPTRPAAGAQIAVDWGQDIHDRVIYPQGAFASGPVTVGVAAQTTLLISTMNGGNSAYLDAANNRLTVPAGLSGLYLISGAFTVTSSASWVRILARRNGTNIAGHSIVGHGTVQAHCTVGPYVYYFSDGQYLDFIGNADAADPCDISAMRVGMIRIGDNFLGSFAVMAGDLMQDVSELQNADE